MNNIITDSEIEKIVDEGKEVILKESLEQMGQGEEKLIKHLGKIFGKEYKIQSSDNGYIEINKKNERKY